MSLKQTIRSVAPHDLLRHYTRIFHPQEMAVYDQLRKTPPQSPNDTSLRPCLERRAIFFHIPKCAGISVARELFGCRAGGHFTLHNYQTAFSQREFLSFYKFTFVRNPWDRLASAYFFLRGGGLTELDHQNSERTVCRFSDFTAFVEGYIARCDFTEILHLRSQHSFLCASDRSPPEVDFIGRFERLSDDFAKIGNVLGIDRQLSHRNAAGSRPQGSYREFYTERTAQIVADAYAYARDIELFDYRF